MPESPLLNIETERLGLEWAGALYESYAADWEAMYERRGSSADRYATTAHRLIEEMEQAWYEREQERYEWI